MAHHSRRTASPPLNSCVRLQKIEMVRPATAQDAALVIEVVRQSITVSCEADHKNDGATLDRWLANKKPESFESWIANPENFCVVAESEGGVRGVGLLHCGGEVRLFYMSPGYQHRGLGRRIHSALESHALSLGLPKLRLESTLLACKFYEALGYIPAGTEKSLFGVLRVYPYEKPLQPNSSIHATAFGGA